MSNQLWSQLLQSQLQRQELDLTAGGWRLQVDAFHAISHETPRRTAVQTRQQCKQKEAPAAWMKDSRGETWNQQQAAERKTHYVRRQPSWRPRAARCRCHRVESDVGSSGGSGKQSMALTSICIERERERERQRELASVGFMS